MEDYRMGTKVLFYGGIILVGFVLGYFLTVTMIVIITIIAAVITIIMRPKREQEIGAIYGILVWIVLGLGTTVMWTTYLYTTGVDLGIPDISQYIFR